MKLLGIDFGTKRIGLALGDTATRLALPFKTIENNAEVLENLKKIVETDLVETFVVGRPLSLSGGDSGETLDLVKDFSAKLKQKIDLPILFED
ncbi:MAG: RuvX/YqgF family protein [Patescibacteria group bacterium]